MDGIVFCKPWCHLLLNQHFRDNGTFYKVQTKELKIGIYVLDNKAIADFDSIQVN